MSKINNIAAILNKSVVFLAVSFERFLENCVNNAGLRAVHIKTGKYVIKHTSNKNTHTGYASFVCTFQERFLLSPFSTVVSVAA